MAAAGCGTAASMECGAAERRDVRRIADHGTIPEGFPFDLGGGSVALIVDPVGQSIGLCSRKSPPPPAR